MFISLRQMCQPVPVIALIALVALAKPTHFARADAVASSQQVPGIRGLAGVACTSQNACYAVGVSICSTDGNTCYAVNDPTPPAQTAAQAAQIAEFGTIVPILEGKAGSPQHVSGADLRAIACPTSDKCYAVGEASGHSYVITLTGGVASTPVETGWPHSLNSIACPTSDTCYAVGSEFNTDPTVGGIIVPITYGQLGNLIPVPGFWGLRNIACPTAHTCYATGIAPGTTRSITGGTVPASTVVPITDGVVGTSLPLPISDVNIACPTSSACVLIGATPTVLSAGGSGVVGGNAAAVALIDGSVAQTGIQMTDAGRLLGLACPVADTCYAVGSSTVQQPGVCGNPDPSVCALLQSSGALAHSSQTTSAIVILQNGGAPTPARVADNVGELDAIACPTSDTCYAVGGSGVVQLSISGNASPAQSGP
jgi:hypothetical protein